MIGSRYEGLQEIPLDGFCIHCLNPVLRYQWFRLIVGVRFALQEFQMLWFLCNSANRSPQVAGYSF